MHLEALDTFISLVELDAQITRYVREQKKIKENRVTFSQQMQDISEQLSAQETYIHSLKKKIDLSDLDLKVIDDQLVQKKLRITNASSPKEFFSLEQEIQALSANKNTVEEKHFSMWNELEIKQKEYQDFSIPAQAQKNELANHIATFEAELKHINNRIIALQEERPSLVAQVPQDLQDKYATMLESMSNPVVPILKDACSGCFYSLTAQNLRNAFKDQLISCSECNRLLYALKEVRVNS